MCSVLIAPVRNEEGIAVMYIINHEDVTWSPNKDEVTLPSMSKFNGTRGWEFGQGRVREGNNVF